MPPSKFEANLTLHVRKFASFSLFLLASSSSNDYFHTYMIIYFLANQLISLIQSHNVLYILIARWIQPIHYLGLALQNICGLLD